MQTLPLQTDSTNVLVADHTHHSGVSWGAIVAGATAAAALSLILVMLGVGLGLSAISPWTYNVAGLGVAAIAWIGFTQLAASAVGGYMAGRLRMRWARVDSDEIYFRDTAHGLLAWALASLLTAGLMAGAVRAVLSGAIDTGTGAAVAAGAQDPDDSGDPTTYFSDQLLRSPLNTTAEDPQLHSVVNTILLSNLLQGGLAVDDRQYLAQLLATRNGLSVAEAESRVDDVYARASQARNQALEALKVAAEAARKAAAKSALWMFVALLLGAFVASLAATFGGRQRDDEQLHRRRA